MILVPADGPEDSVRERARAQQRGHRLLSEAPTLSAASAEEVAR